MNRPDDETAVVRGLRAFLSGAGRLSLFYLLRRATNNWPIKYIDWWVAGWTAFSIAAYIISFSNLDRAIIIAIAGLSGFRVFEYLVYQCNVAIFGKAMHYYGRQAPHDYQRLAILVLCNYVETVFWFATWYSFMAGAGMLRVSQQFYATCILRESIVSMVGNSTSCFEPTSFGSFALATTQNVVGLFLTIVLLARFIAILPRIPAISEEK